MREPLVPPLAAIATGIFAAQLAAFERAELLAGIAAFSLLSLFCLARGMRRWSVLLCLLALALAGAWCGTASRTGPPPFLDADRDEILVFNGCVAEPSVVRDGRLQFVLEIEPGTRARVTRYPAQDEILPELGYGQVVEFEGRARPTRNFGNPGAFDYAGHLARQNIYWNVTARTPPAALPGERCGTRWRAGLFAIRDAAGRRIDRLYAASPFQTAMLRAILLGDASQLERVWTDEFRATGTFHALVISGAHVGALSLFFLILLRALSIPPPAATLVTVIAAWIYAGITGFGTPVVRAASAVTLLLATQIFYRRRRLVNALAAIALGFLLADPEQLLEASFQLSFLAVGLLGAVALPWLEVHVEPFRAGLRRLWLARWDMRLPPRVAQWRVELRLLAETLTLALRLPPRAAGFLVALPLRFALATGALLVSSAILQAGLALPMAYYFHRFSWSGFTANAFVIPLMSAIVPLGFLSSATGWEWTAGMAARLLDLCQSVVHWHAVREPVLRVPDPPLWLGLAMGSAIVAVAVTMEAGRAVRWAARGVATGLLAVILWHPFAPRVDPGWLELTAIDVGQGDALLAAFPGGGILLVDGGGVRSFDPKSRPRLDMGEDVVAPYLWTRSMRRVDWIAVTHPDQDHIGGVSALVRNFRPKELWLGAAPPPASPQYRQWQELLETAAECGVRAVTLNAGDRRDFGAVRMDVLAPPLIRGASLSPNNGSLVIRLQYGERAFLLPGDIERRIETGLLRSGLVTAADVLKLAHHGSRTSTSDPFLAAVRPAIALVSAGHANPYGHPHPDVLRRLTDQGIAVLRTDELGMVTIRTDGHRLDVEANRWKRRRTGSLPAFER